jgi:hypothetical protein
MGKSFTMTYLTELLSSEFDLVISFCGSQACSPDLRVLFSHKFDPRFMFDRFSVHFLRTLLEQQEEIKSRGGPPRRVLLLFDDVETDPEEANYLGFLATRHRHYNISMMYCSVRYSSIHKTFRSATDVLLLFNTPMYSDRKMLLLEHSSNTGLASFAMKNMEMYHCLVMESGHKQSLRTFKAPGFVQTEDLEIPEVETEMQTAPSEEVQNSTDEVASQIGNLGPEPLDLETHA